MDPELADAAARRQLAADLRAEADSALSVTRDDTLELTSVRQLGICEDAARRLLELRTGDTELDAAAEATREKVRAARRWIWVSQRAAILLAMVASARG